MDTTGPAVPRPSAIETARATLAEYDALIDPGDPSWADLSAYERGDWAARLAEALRMALIALGQQP